MFEFETLVYLDVEKTGSTYTSSFLRRFVASKEIDAQRHAPVDQRDPGKLYLISCRDPLQQYRSLYSYGCKGKGKLHKRLTERFGLDDLYDATVDGFMRWLRLLLSPRSGQKYLHRSENHPVLATVGPQTLRFLRLALPDYRNLLTSVRNRDDLKTLYNEHALAEVVLRQETLNENLASLTAGRYSNLFKNVIDVDKYLEKASIMNKSEDIGIDLRLLPPRILELVQEREWFFFEVLGYESYLSGIAGSGTGSSP